MLRPPALADDIAVEVHLYGEVLVMVGAMFAGEDVFEPFTGVLLNDLLQHRLVVLERALAGRLRRRLDVAQHKALRFLQAAGVQIDRRRDRLKDVGEDARPVLAAGMLLAVAEPQQLPAPKLRVKPQSDFSQTSEARFFVSLPRAAPGTPRRGIPP